MVAIIVISDLHLGSGVVDDFEPEIEEHFVSFLEEIASKEDGVELVINGDFLDFLQAPPYKDKFCRETTEDGTRLCFTESQSLQKLDSIYLSHKRSFEALGLFLARRSSNRIVLLPGNHDADFFWPKVRAKFLDLVISSRKSLAGQITIWLEQVFRPHTCPEVWIEHGHQHDPVNDFFLRDVSCWGSKSPPILLDRWGEERLYECIGTRLMVEFLNDLDREYPYIDNVKPFWRFLQIFGASALQPGYAPLTAAVAIASMNMFVAKTLLTRPNKEVLKINRTDPSSSRSTSASIAGLILSAYTKATKDSQLKFIEQIRDRGYSLRVSPKIALSQESNPNPLVDFLIGNLDLLQFIDPGVSEGTLKIGSSFFANETDELRGNAYSILSKSSDHVKLVIMGHTHEKVLEKSYFNTGSWTRYCTFPDGVSVNPWKLLQKRAWQEFPYELNYAIVPESDIEKARLHIYRENG